MKKKVAILFDGNILNLRGKVNAIINRIAYLQLIADYDIDVFVLQSYHAGLARILWGKTRHRHLTVFQNGNVIAKILWRVQFFTDYLLSFRLNRKPLLESIYLNHLYKKFERYDLILCHSFACGQVAMSIKKHLQTPYCITWHGSEIHNIPPKNDFQLKTTKEIIEMANCNFFVSQSLADFAMEHVTNKLRYEVLYNGINSSFCIYENEKRELLRKKYGVEKIKVISYVGNLKPIKNADMLPDIFNAIANKYKKPIKFWIIGDGELRSVIESKLSRMNIDCTLWGNISTNTIPEMLQCVDIQLLISKNEGFSLSVIEALACGAAVLASKAGGILEILEGEYVFDIDNSFIDKISDKAVALLNGEMYNLSMSVPRCEEIAEKENAIIKQILS